MMEPKDPFKMFDETKNKKQKKMKKGNKSALIRDRRNDFLANNEFIKIPSKAFTKLQGCGEYTYLKRGLLVQKNILTIDDVVFDILEDIMPINKSNIGKELSQLSWHKSKEMSQELGGQLMTTSELFCIFEYLKTRGRTKPELELKKDLIKSFEWVDGLVMNKFKSKGNDIVKEKTLYTHTFVKNLSVKGGTHVKIKDLSVTGYYDNIDIDYRSGFPKALGKKGAYSYLDPYDESQVVVKKIPVHTMIGQKSLSLFLDKEFLKTGVPYLNDRMRMCYRVMAKK